MKYQQIVDLAIAFADRQDIEVTANIDNFILLTEARINRLLKTRKQTARIYAPTRTGQEYYCLPGDYSGMRDIQLNSKIPSQEHKITQFNYMSPEQMNVQKGKPTGDMLYYTVIADQLEIHPTQDAGKSIEMIYYQKVPPLSKVIEENWVSKNHPDMYTAGITGEIEKFAKNYESATMWFGELSSFVSELDYADDLERWAGQALVMRTA